MILAAAAVALTMAGNYPDCVLQRLPGVANDAVAKQIVAACVRAWPDTVTFGPFDEFALPRREHYPNGAACTIAKANATASPFAAGVIQANCYRLYGRP